jgi:hypothetical protein
MTLTNISRVVEGTAVTTSRGTFGVGLPGSEGRLHFATYGDPMFQAILQQVEAFPLPACVRRLEAEVPEVPATVVGYAVAERDAEGLPRCRLVTSWYELATLNLDEAASVSADEEKSLHQCLSAMTRQELVMM